MKKIHYLVGLGVLGLMLSGLVLGATGCRCRRKPPEPGTDTPRREASVPAVETPVRAERIPRTADAVLPVAAEAPSELDVELRKLQDTLSHVSGELLTAEQKLRRENPELKDLFDQAMAAHARYQEKLNEVDEIKTLRARTDALRREHQRVFDRKKQQMQENE